VDLLDQRLGQFVAGTVDDEVDAAEMVRRLHNVINVDTLIRNADRIRLKDEAGLFVGQTAALDVVGVIGEVDLRAMIDTPAYFSLLFFTKSLQQGALLDEVASAGGSPWSFLSWEAEHRPGYSMSCRQGPHPPSFP